MRILIFSSEWFDGTDMDWTIWNCDCHDDVACNIDRGTPVTVNGSLGLWNGRREVKAKEDDLWTAIEKCISGCDDFTIYQTGKHTLEVTGYHHDGTNSFKLTQYK